MVSRAPGRAGQTRSRMRIGLVFAAIAALVSADITVSAIQFPTSAVASETASSTEALKAANPSLFDPSLIISDALFYDSNAMSAAEIQAFLDAKIGTCLNGNCLNVAMVDYPGRARDVHATTRNLICEAIPAGYIRVSELIYRAQVACGISAKVILVTLQKEQGLVLKTAPSDTALRFAMGMACPDTAPCDTAFAGLGTQIVSGTRQLKVYRAGAFARQPGTHFIGWSPNSSCGGTYITIQNYATAALYNYTPYQPNSAALGNLYGTGDSCSSYGNRNFWAFFTDWFGSTTGGGRAAIDEAYVAAGGAATLGFGVAYLDCPLTANRCWPKYEKGSIYWSPGSGADIVLGAKDDAYRALGGPDGALGYPNTGEYPYAQNGGGSAQVFEKGSLFESPAGIFPTYGAVRTAYFAKQGTWGELGWPTSGVRCEQVNCSQIYQFGAIAVVGADVSYMGQTERDAWVGSGGISGTLGVPISTPIAYTQNGGGSARIFSGGTLFTSSAGAFAVATPIRAAYFAQQGAWGALGWPTSAQECAQTGCWQRFTNGSIITNGTASYILETTEYDAYLAAGGPEGALGLPTSTQYTYTQNGGGTTRVFANGSLFSSAAGTFAVTEPIKSAYFAQQGAWGPLGWPASAMTCTSGTCVQQFQNGSLSNAGAPPAVDPGSGSGDTVVYIGRITALAATTNLGMPTSDVLVYPENGGGVARVFGSTTVFSSAAGAYPVSGAVRSAYFAKRGAWGELGWPIAVQQCVSGYCWQRFQNGVLFPSSTGAVVLSAAEYQTYSSFAGPAGELGSPASDLISYTQNGGGTTRVFTRGSLFTSAAGSFAVSEPIRTAYFAKQGAWGELGWPSSAVVKRGTTSAQLFQNGAISVVGGKAIYLTAAERDAWVALGGPSGALGLPESVLYTYTQNGGGTARVFSNGSLFTSPAGAFAVGDPIKSAYFATQGAWGEFGWPTAAAVTQGSSTIQQFQNGAIVVNGSSIQYLSAAERDIWLAAGGATGTLGVPVSLHTYTQNGGGVARVYTGGSVFSSAAGMFAVTEPVRSPYFASQGAWGSYGWPTSAMTCAGGTCVQQFQNGSISVSVP
jgi:uncharacterized protein with LGFP repeats